MSYILTSIYEYFYPPTVKPKQQLTPKPLQQQQYKDLDTIIEEFRMKFIINPQSNLQKKIRNLSDK